uniref:VQ domain-containing protein n=1 Tax=Leersia perrieri TaxID=77586 RepID=A0A0D9VQJ8_9ORYZ
MVMDKSNLPPPPPPPTSALKSLNKSSYKISKQSSSSSLSATSMPPPRPSPPPPPPPATAATPSSTPAAVDHPPPQPPVYNIDKSDFRDVVQKPSAIPSRLHRIRPPPLAPPRPPPILPPAPPALSPLPPLPAVCMTAESPISAYMRRLRGMPSPIHVPTSPLGFGCLPSPRTPPSPGVAMPATSPRVRDQ